MRMLYDYIHIYKTLKWTGHIWRSENIANNIFLGRLNGKRPRSPLRLRWEERVKTDLTEISQGTRIKVR